MTYFTKILFIFTLLILVYPRISFASEIRLEAQKAKVYIGEEFSVNVLVQSLEPLNAIEGKIIFDEDQIEVDDISDGNSVINFWIQRPKVKRNIITFSGATPVGFSGNNQKIFSINFKAIKSGDAPINIAESFAYINDGNATLAQMKLLPTQVIIENGTKNIDEIKNDKEPPEDFTPFLIKDELINNNKYSVIFETQDKGSGINKYEIKEGKYSFYKEIESPATLKDQSLSHDIYIRALDNNSNKRVVILPAKNQTSLFRQIGVIKYLFGIIVIIGSLIFLWKRFLKH